MNTEKAIETFRKYFKFYNDSTKLFKKNLELIKEVLDEKRYMIAYNQGAEDWKLSSVAIYLIGLLKNNPSMDYDNKFDEWDCENNWDEYDDFEYGNKYIRDDKYLIATLIVLKYNNEYINDNRGSQIWYQEFELEYKGCYKVLGTSTQFHSSPTFYSESETCNEEIIYCSDLYENKQLNIENQKLKDENQKLKDEINLLKLKIDKF